VQGGAGAGGARNHGSASSSFSVHLLPQESKWLYYSGWEEEPEPPRAMPNRALVLCLVVLIFFCPILIVNHSIVEFFFYFMQKQMKCLNWNMVNLATQIRMKMLIN